MSALSQERNPRLGWRPRSSLRAGRWGEPVVCREKRAEAASPHAGPGQGSVSVSGAETAPYHARELTIHSTLEPELRGLARPLPP